MKNIHVVVLSFVLTQKERTKEKVKTEKYSTTICYTLLRKINSTAFSGVRQYFPFNAPFHKYLYVEYF
jgi:hypothetical protein